MKTIEASRSAAVLDLRPEVVSSDCPRTHSYAERRGSQTIVWLRSEHDAATVDELSKLLAESIASTPSDVIVDLSGVEFMAAAPVGVLMRTRDFLQGRSRTLVLRAPSRSAALILDVCGVEWVPGPRVPMAS